LGIILVLAGGDHAFRCAGAELAPSDMDTAGGQLWEDDLQGESSVDVGQAGLTDAAFEGGR